jgi:hypothetical protein
MYIALVVAYFFVGFPVATLLGVTGYLAWVGLGLVIVAILLLRHLLKKNQGENHG